MSFTVIIPARYNSTRLPGKPLLDLAGKPMVQHVYERASASAATRVVIATDDARIESVAKDFGAEVCMTAADHESGTDRLQEVAEKLALDSSHIVVNVQGDEPLIPPAVIDQVASQLAANSDCGIATLAEAITDPAEVFNPNAVKLVRNEQHRALYFSRAAIPWSRDDFQNSVPNSPPTLPAGVTFLRHIGIYAYRVSLLHQFVNWPYAVLEQTEKLEQLRAMENGVAIYVGDATEIIPSGIDTPDDLAAVRAHLAHVGAKRFAKIDGDVCLSR